MGPVAKDQREDLEQDFLFGADFDLGHKPRKASPTLDGGKLPSSWRKLPPIQTSDKSRLIAEYLANFQHVTRGGVYIDGFAGPQSRDHEEAWTARRVLEIRPARIRCFWLCDIERQGLAQLRALKALHHRPKEQRRVYVMEGDFNKTIKTILINPTIRRKTAVFALLDQRNTECHWKTVQTLAARAGRYKIELMYFVGVSWLHRSLAASTRPERLSEIDLWWGGDGWRELLSLKQHEVAQHIADRFKTELSYHYVNFYPVYNDCSSRKTSFYLIHASDHDEAPKLMTRSYVKIIGDIDGAKQNKQNQLL